MKLVHGDSLDVLKEMEANSVDTIVTDPPYFLISESGGGGFMNKEWDGIIGLWKYQLADEVFADFVIRLLTSVRVEKSLAEESIALGSANTMQTESQTSNNANFAKQTSTLKIKQGDFVQAIALTKQGLLDLLNELSVTHTKLIQFLNGESETALYVIPILSLQKELKNYVAKPVTLLSKAKETEVTRITFTKTEVQRISDATEGMIGTSLEKPFTNEMNGNADIVVNTVLLKKYSATTSNPTESEEIIRSLTLLLCAYDATRTSKEIQQHMIVTFLKVIFLEAKRVLKPGGTVMAFSGSRTQHHLAQGLEQSGYLLKDCIMYMYGSGFPKATDISKQLDKGNKREVVGKDKAGNGLGLMDKSSTIGGEFDLTKPNSEEAKLWNGWKSHGLKPAYEPILVAVKPNEGTYAANALKHGVSGLNIDGGRIGTDTMKFQKASSLGNDLNMEGGKAQKDYKGTDTTGRFPANIILDEEAGGLLDEQSGVSKEGNGKTGGGKNKGSDINLGGGVATTRYPGQGGASRFFYCAKASKAERNAGCEGLEEKNAGKMSGGKFSNQDGTSTNNHDRVRTNHHPTVKPLKLMEYLCTLTNTPTGGVVLDPFMGSGTTGLACKNTERDFIGIERKAEYIEIARARLGDN